MIPLFMFLYLCCPLSVAQAFFFLGTGSATFFLFIIEAAVGSICDETGEEILPQSRIFFFLVASLTFSNILTLKYLLHTPTGQQFVLHSHRSENFSVENDVEKSEITSDGNGVMEAIEKGTAEQEKVERKVEDAEEEDMSSWELLKVIKWPAGTALVVYLLTYTSYPLYTAFSTSETFTRYIFPIDASMAFIGRQFNVLRKGRLLRTPFSFFVAACVQSILLFALFLVSVLAGMQMSEAAFIILFCYWGMTKGFFGTVPYSQAGQLVKNPRNKSKSIVVLNVLSVACLFVASALTFTVVPNSPSD